MVGNLLLRGMIAGLIAAVLAFGFAYVYGEPEIDASIAIEEMKAEAEAAANPSDEPEEPELVTRATQATTGLATGLLVHGAAVGGLFALVFAWAYGRVSALGARATAALLAGAAFVSVVLVPQLKYAPNPPAVGSSDTIGARTSLFFVVLIVAILAMLVAVAIARRLWQQSGGWGASITAGLVWLAVIAIAMVALPAIQEVPADFPADVLWRFRISSLGVHAILWTVIGLVFGLLAEAQLERGRTRPAAALH